MVKSLVAAFIVAVLPFASSAAETRSSSQDYRTANALFFSSRYRQAIPLYQKLLLRPPEGVSTGELRVRIADSWFRLGAYQDALGAYRAAVVEQKESQRAETQYWIGFCCFLQGRNAEAADEFLKIPARYPTSGMWVSTAYYWAGRACERMGKAEEAAGYYRKAGGSGISTQGRFALRKAEAAKRRPE